MRIRPATVADLQRLSDYLKEDHPRYRQPTLRKLYVDIRSLKQWPGRGRPGAEEATREILFLPCLTLLSIASHTKPLICFR